MNQQEGSRPRSPHGAETAGGAGTTDMAQAWLHLSEQLTPLIGESGFCALFGRALRLSAVRFERLADCSSARPVADVLMSLTRILNEIGPEQAEAANGALLDTFTTLLGSLIGEALTKQLLHVAQQGADGQKHGQEQM